MSRIILGLFCCIGFGANSVLAEEGKVYDKSQYHLLCPVPDDKLKEMSADRPDKTEGPFTIDPGRYQIEFDMATYTYQRSKKDNSRTNSYTLFSPNFRIGLMDKLELNIIGTAFNSVREKDLSSGEKTKNQGFDDTILRLKYNIWGNEDNLPTALGIIPFVKIPTNQDHLGNRSYDGGLLLPFDIKISESFGLGLMTGTEYLRGDNVNKHVFKFANSASLSYDFTDKANGFIELYTERSNEHNSRWIVTFDLGTTYSLTDNWQIDGGVYLGLTPEADNITPFIGMSARF